MIRTFLILATCLLSLQVNATTYYLSSKSGNDANSGTSAKHPFKTLLKASSLKLKAGDKLLLSKGETFYGSLDLVGLSGQEKNPIVVSSYGKGAQKPLIDAKGKLNGVLIKDCSHIKVSDIEITADGGGIESRKENKKYMRCGVLLTTGKAGDYSGITIKNLLVRDIFLEEPGFDRGAGEKLTGNGTQSYGWGIRIINFRKDATLNDILIQNCHVKNVAHSGIRFTGKGDVAAGEIKNINRVKVYDNLVEHAGGPAMQSSTVRDIEFNGNKTNYSGSPNDSRKWGRGSGLWVWNCFNAMIQYNEFRNANGPGDSAGCHIDFNNRNVVIQYNVSENNVGGFIEVLGNNYNCTYRYNVSINDGSRKLIKDKTLGAGTMIGVNGFVGFGKKPVGPFNLYLYNNTIYVKEGLNPEVGFSKNTNGIFIANNIFYLEGHATYDHRKNFLPSAGPIPNVVFKNNLYLKEDNWPSSDHVMITDSMPIYGDPQCAYPGGLTAKDYIPKNIQLIKDKGIEIHKIPGDDLGLALGFRVDKDILGNKIKGKPDMGAIEIK
ncbi:right-handed parallel beta-helix repeat-containing protein [Reichenbachiella versicolor]|uniref:right-handed parallel beta-helix repeat-containing protein n=1 Tax=Reichenbachiella versicolor TaxID=1821036 RepID=UPI000D6E3675|nr:right-handed parallel beta-helix repeat-containing protein [Reichenbachiella versicolor]